MDHLQTEARNPASAELDELTTLQFVRLMNAEDSKVIPAVASHAEAIARAIEVTAEKLRGGGRLIYVGAGTSGRLGVLDATECPPTFNAPAGLVIGLIAGGPSALTRAVEGAEDHPEYAARDLTEISLSAADVLVGIATSGRTPYVLGAVDYARSLGAFTIGLSCNADADIIPRVDLAITPVVGPEVLSGSTRLKSGTATKLILNTISTGVMVRLGKTFGNLMVDLRATNDKLRNRTNRIVREATGLDPNEANALLERCDRELKTALVSHLANVSAEKARDRLRAANGRVRAAVGSNGHSVLVNGTEDLVLGIDGGGTRTVALLAKRRTDDSWQILGRGEAGPSNRQAVGTAAALAALESAVDGAFAAAGKPRNPVRSACLGLAGAGRPKDREVVREWAARVHLAASVEVIEDCSPAGGRNAGWLGSRGCRVGPDRWLCPGSGRTDRSCRWVGPVAWR